MSDKQFPRVVAQTRVDVSAAGRVLTALESGAELPTGEQEVYIVGSHKILRHAHNGRFQTLLAVVVRRLLRDVPNELSYLDISSQVPLEGTKQNFPLTGFKAVHDRRNGPHYIIFGKLDEFFIDKFPEPEMLDAVVHTHSVFVGIYPFLPVVGSFLVERHIDEFPVFRSVPAKVDLVLINVGKIVPRLLRSTRSQTLVVLDLEPSAVVVTPLPLLVLHHREELQRVSPPRRRGHLDDRSDELLQESVELAQ